MYTKQNSMWAYSDVIKCSFFSMHYKRYGYEHLMYYGNRENEKLLFYIVYKVIPSNWELWKRLGEVYAKKQNNHITDS